MPNALYDSGLEGLVSGLIDGRPGGSTFKAVLVNLAAYGIPVSGATNASPISITTSSAHGLTTGQSVVVTKVGGNTNARGVWAVTVTSTTTFTLDGSTGNAAYTSGGYVIPLSLHDFLNDIPPGARVATATLTATTPPSAGVIDFNDVSFPLVPDTQPIADALVIYLDAATEGASRLVEYKDSVASGLPVDPNGGDINVVWNDTADRVIRVKNVLGVQ